MLTSRFFLVMTRMQTATHIQNEIERQNVPLTINSGMLVQNRIKATCPSALLRFPFIELIDNPIRAASSGRLRINPN